MISLFQSVTRCCRGRRPNCTQVFEKVQRLVPQLAATCAMADCDEASVHGGMSPTTLHAAAECWFHYAQATVKPTNKIGLKEACGSDAGGRWRRTPLQADRYSSYNIACSKKISQWADTRTFKQASRCPPQLSGVRSGATLSGIAMSGFAFSVASFALL